MTACGAAGAVVYRDIPVIIRLTERMASRAKLSLLAQSSAGSKSMIVVPPSIAGR